MEKLIEQFSLGLFFWQLILFVALVLLLQKFAWKPILNSVNEREEGIKNALDEAENARKEMQNLNADNERILKEARAQRDTLLKEAREMKEGIISEAKNEAQVQAAKIVEQAQATIEAEKQAAITDLKNQVAELSVGIAEKVVRGELADKNKQTKLVEELLKEVFSSKVSGLTIGLIDLLVENKRLSILTDVAKKYTVIYDELKGIEVAKVTTAVPLTEELNNKVLAKVKEITGKEATIENIVNPDIIGGFILRIGDVQYDASITNKLQVLKRQFEN